MSQLKHAGVHWNNGPSKDARLYALPSPTILMLSTEARYRSADAFARGKALVWRAVPRVGKRPAELKYNASKIADECLLLWDEQPHPPGERLIFQALNEPTINTERGDNEDDFSNLDARFVRLARLESELEPELRRRLPAGTLLMSTPHVPDGRAYDRLPLWWDAANQYDVIGHHEYGSPEGIAERVQWHLDTWPERYTFLGEWHNDDPRRTLQLLAEIGAREPRFLGATWFIGKWFDAPSWWPAWKNLQDNDDLYNLFMDPPVIKEPAIVYRVPAWTPAYEHIRDGAIQVADEFDIPRRRLLGLCLGESGFGLQSFDRWASIERSARMVAAITSEDWPRVEAIFGEIAGTPTNDISFGPCHQSWWWSLTAEQQQEHPEWRHDLARIMDFRAHLIEDHGAALRLAAGKITLDAVALAGPGNDTDLDILCLYNKPSVPPAQNPNRPNYQRSLAEADRILTTLEPEKPVEPTSTQYEPFPDPQPAGTLAHCEGVIFHGSRSGKAGNPLEAEYRGTAGYEVNNAAGLGWNATVGPGVVAIHMDARHWGWNARRASSRYVGVEIAQPTVNDPLPDSVPVALADYIFDHVWPVWGEVWHFPSHAEIEDWGETGANDGKTDLYPTGDDRMNVFRDKVYARLNARKAGHIEPVEPEQPPEVDLANLVGVAYAEDGVVIPALLGAKAAGDWAQIDAVVSFLRNNDPHRAA